MIDLYGNRLHEKYTFRKVDWASWKEGEDLGDVTGGSVELAAFTDLKATCSFSFTGKEPLEQDSLVRILYSFEDEHGESVEYPIGTFFVEYSEITNIADYSYDGERLACNGLMVSGTADGYSVLKVLNDKKCGLPLTVTAGSYPVQDAVAYMENLGLLVNVTEESSYTLKEDHTFNADDTYLVVVNWLLTTANYSAVMPDAMGVCQVSKYVDPSKREPVAEFANDDNSIMYPEVVEENDWQNTDNAVALYYQTDTIAIYALAKNISGSKASLESRGGREKTYVETVSEVSGDTSQEMRSNLEKQAVKKLRDNSSEIERVRWSHPYIPIRPNDSISVRYGAIGSSNGLVKDWMGNVTNMSISLVASTRCDTEMRRFVPNSITVSVESEILWEASE